MADTKKTEKKFSTYKGRPLVRCNDEIYYGSMEEPYVIRMQIKSKKDVNGTEIADKVTVQLMATDPYLSPRKQLVKSSEKKGLFLAMDIADIWLERALATKCNLTLNLRSNRFWLLRFFLYGEPPFPSREDSSQVSQHILPERKLDVRFDEKLLFHHIWLI